MTREECISVLQALWRYKDCGYSEHKVRESLDMAIKALNQQPSEDCIDRSKLGLTDFEIVMCDGDYKEAFKMLLDKIEKAPNAYSAVPFINKSCISEGVCHDIAVQKLQTIQSNTPSTTDWEHYADKLYDAAYQHGYEQLKDEIDEMLHVMLESDPRTFSNPVSDNGLYYDAIADVLKKLREFHNGMDNS